MIVRPSKRDDLKSVDGNPIDFTEIDPRRFEQLSHDDQSRMVCALSGFPTMGLTRLGALLNRSIPVMSMMRRRGLALGCPNTWEWRGNDSSPEPDAADIAWRKKHGITPAMLKPRVKGVTLDEVIESPDQQREEDPLEPTGEDGEWRIKRTQRVFRRVEEHDLGMLRDLVMKYNRLAPEGLDWDAVYRLVMFDWQIERLMRDLHDEKKPDPKKLDELMKLQKALQDLVKLLDLPAPGADRAAELWQQALAAVPEFLCEHAWLLAHACARCGQIEFIYLPVYRRLVEVLNTAIMLSDELSPDGEIARKLLEKAEDPLFMAQLSDLGMAWCDPLVAMMQGLSERHPGIPEGTEEAWAAEIERWGEGVAERGAVTDEDRAMLQAWLADRMARVREVHPPVVIDEWAEALAAFFGISPVNFMPECPFSPLSRIVRHEVGLEVTTPEF